MCGIVGLLLAAEEGHANQELFDSLTALQHRGQGELALLTPREELAGYGGWFSPDGKAVHSCGVRRGGSARVHGGLKFEHLHLVSIFDAYVAFSFSKKCGLWAGVPSGAKHAEVHTLGRRSCQGVDNGGLERDRLGPMSAHGLPCLLSSLV